MALDKESKTAGKKQYHIHLKPGDIGKYVLLPGDPARSDRVARYLENAELVANNREHRTFTGYYKGVKISVTSTGMGCLNVEMESSALYTVCHRRKKRAALIAEHFDNPVKVAHKREFLTYTGTLDGVLVTETSTNFGEYSNDAADYPSGWEQRAIEVGIEAMREMIRKDKEKKTLYK